MWKVGGTNLNALAVANGERLYHHSCFKPLTSFPAAVNPRCDVTFIDYPAALPPGLPAAWQPKWLFLIMLREPKRAALSLFYHHHANRTAELFLRWLSPASRNGHTHRHAGRNGDNASDAISLVGGGLAFIDNLYVRWLSGAGFGSLPATPAPSERVAHPFPNALDEPTWRSSPLSLSQSHFDRAASQLRLYDMVLISESFNADRCRLQTLGWTYLETARAEQPGTSNHAAEESLLNDPVVTAALARTQQWDIPLYTLAQSTAAEQRERERANRTGTGAPCASGPSMREAPRSEKDMKLAYTPVSHLTFPLTLT